MASWTIYHNPRCAKSRQALKLLRDKGIEPKVVEYLKQVPAERELEMLVMKLGIRPEQLVRKGEAAYKAHWKGLRLNDHEWIRVMHEHPELIERPIIVKDHKAVIGRTAERIEELLR
ncbi:MAG: arsenate reductase (glutaredoxin) [Flavobacteriales bacterium]